VAALADTRQVDGYDTENKAFKDEAQMLNQTMKALYYERYFDRAMKRCVQWFTVTGTGFIWPTYRKTRMGPGADSALCFDAYGLLDVMQFMPPADGDNQGCYANVVMKLVPMPQAHSMFPQFQHKLKPMSKKRYDNAVANKRMSLAEMMTTRTLGGKISDQGNYCEFRYMPIRDMRINTTGVPIPMGTPGGSESYVVPYVGQEIAGTDVEGGKRKMKIAGPEDCYLYPHMRLIICSDGLEVPLYDGPNFDWSGMMPARYAADDWPWERISYSLIRDIYEIERSRQHLERSLDQMVRHRGDPSIGYDRTRVATKEAEAFDPWKERGRLGFEGEADEKAWRMLIPSEMINAPEWMFNLLRHYEESEDYMLGINQIGAMAKAKMGVGGDGIEKMLELAGPLVKDISRSMEPPTREIMITSMWNIFQWYGTRRLMNYVGPDGVTAVSFDFDPEKLYPSHAPGEDTSGASAFTARERAKAFAEQLHLSITPNSLHAVTQTAQKMLYLQLWRGGFPISPETVAKALDIPNFEQEKQNWFAWKKTEIEMQAAAKVLAGSLEPQGAPPAGPAGGKPGGAKPGRPPSGKRPATAVTKGSAEGPRGVIKES
jgi:hypothetical protein